MGVTHTHSRQERRCNGELIAVNSALKRKVSDSCYKVILLGLGDQKVALHLSRIRKHRRNH